jgi:hypothetical protein
MVIPYSYNTSEEILAKCSSGEITPEDAISVLKIRRNYYRQVIRGGAADKNYPITPEEATEKISTLENAIETLRAILHPPVFPIDLTDIVNKLREIRDRRITGGYAKKEALALFDQTLRDFKNDTIFKADKFCEDIVGRPTAIDSQIRQMIDECDKINEIRTEIEGIPEPSLPQPPTEMTAAAPDTQPPDNPVKATIRWLINRQYIIKHTETETPVMLNGAIDHIKPSVLEWRIARTVAFIYRELMKAAENGEIPLGKNVILDFMINNLKQKNGGDITHDSLVKAEKRTNPDKPRQNNNLSKLLA